jgi:hypothetical protein
VPNKGKRLLPRVLRHIDSQQTLTLFTLLLATFGQLDVVREAPLLDLPADTLAIVLKDAKRTRSDIEAGNTAFNNAIAPPFLTTLSKLPLRIVTGMMSLLIERNDVRVLARSKAGIAFFTLFLSRAELLKQGQATEVAQPDDAEKTQWCVFPCRVRAKPDGRSGPTSSTRSSAACKVNWRPSSHRPDTRLICRSACLYTTPRLPDWTSTPKTRRSGLS